MQKERKEMHAQKHDKKEEEIAQVSKNLKKERGENHTKREFMFHPPYPPYTHMCIS